MPRDWGREWGGGGWGGGGFLCVCVSYVCPSPSSPHTHPLPLPRPPPPPLPHLQVRLVLHLPHPSRRRQQGFGGDAPPVDARAADVVPFDHAHLEATLHRVQGGAVAADAAPDDEQVVVVGGAGDRGGGRDFAGEGAAGARRDRARGEEGGGGGRRAVWGVGLGGGGGHGWRGVCCVRVCGAERTLMGGGREEGGGVEGRGGLWQRAAGLSRARRGALPLFSRSAPAAPCFRPFRSQLPGNGTTRTPGLGSRDWRRSRRGQEGGRGQRPRQRCRAASRFWCARSIPGGGRGRTTKTRSSARRHALPSPTR